MVPVMSVVARTGLAETEPVAVSVRRDWKVAEGLGKTTAEAEEQCWAALSVPSKSVFLGPERTDWAQKDHGKAVR